MYSYNEIAGRPGYGLVRISARDLLTRPRGWQPSPEELPLASVEEVRYPPDLDETWLIGPLKGCYLAGD